MLVMKFLEPELAPSGVGAGEGFPSGGVGLPKKGAPDKCKMGQLLDTSISQDSCRDADKTTAGWMKSSVNVVHRRVTRRNERQPGSPGQD